MSDNLLEFKETEKLNEKLEKVWVSSQNSWKGVYKGLDSTLCNANKNLGLDDCPDKKSSQQKTPRVSVQNSAPKVYTHKFDKGRVDKRVSLNVAPLVNGKRDTDSSFVDRVTYVLGQKNLNGTYPYGFLYGCLNKSCGLIFPYTPSLQFNHSVNYDTTDIYHSNLHALHYKNTPPPTISLSATFTADTRDNALHMLSAIWFLRAVSKCDFGEHPEESINKPGMPPPVLYLNGYHQIMDNIPVVVESFNYQLPEDKDYVQLGINLNAKDTGKFNYSYTNQNNVSDEDIFINGIQTALKNVSSKTTQILTNGNPNGIYYFSNWLPTELKFQINLKISPNLMKYKKQFDLNKYKMGLYNTKSWETKLAIPTANGVCGYEGMSPDEIEQILIKNAQTSNAKLTELIAINKDAYEEADSVHKKAIKKFFDDNEEDDYDSRRDYQDAFQSATGTFSYTKSNLEENIKNMENQLEENVHNVSMDILKLRMVPKQRKFDKSGWTW